MKVIPFDTIKKLNITPDICYQWVCQALTQKRTAILPAKISLKPGTEGVFYNTMPAIIPDLQVFGVKEVTRYPLRVPSLDSEIFLYNLKNGSMLAIMDGNWITAMRTGAVAAHSISLFAVKNFKQIGLIGLGNTARATIKVLETIFPEREITLKLLKYKNQHIIFQKEFQNNNKIKFEFYDKLEDVVRKSDIIISAITYSENDICKQEWFKQGVLVIPIHTRGFSNCDLFFDKVFADDRKHVCNFKYFDKFKRFAEVTDVMEKKELGRTDDKERIIVYNIGIAMHDIFFAKKIYDLCYGECKELYLNGPEDKFWV